MIDSKTQAKLREKYNPDGSVLRQAQLRMLDILKVVDGICRKHNISYWLSSGTLLGAVRHEGFIPWDDDLDIEMLRGDYLKLLSILRKELPDNLVLQDEHSEKNYPYLFAKVRDRNSCIKEHNQYLLSNEGLYIDIFNLEKSFYPIYKISGVLYSELCLKQYRRKWIFKINYFLLKKIVYPIFRLTSILSKSNTLRHTLGVNFMRERKTYEIFPLREMKFEGYNFFVPHDSNAYLNRMFGDFMKLPEEIEMHGNIEYVGI